MLAVVAGRFLEQLVGLARVSDLTLFWALVAILAAIPGTQAGQEEERGIPDGSTVSDSPMNRTVRAFPAPGAWRLLILLILVAGIGWLTWTKSIDYARAAVTASSINGFVSQGDFAGGLAASEKAIALAPDVFVYHNHRAAVLDTAQGAGEPLLAAECAQRSGIPYRGCLGQEIYQSNRLAVFQRPLHYRARVALAGTTLTLATLTGSPVLAEETIRLHLESLQLMPHSWALWNRLASAYIHLDRPRQALEAAGRSLAITEETKYSASAHCIKGKAQSDLEALDESVKSLTKCLELNSAGASAREAHRVLAGVYAKMGNQDLAERHLELSRQVAAP